MPYSPLQLFLDSFRPPIEAQLLADFVNPKLGEKVLDIGCGRGYIGYTLAANHPHLDSITCIDIHQESLQFAKSKFQEFYSLVKAPPPLDFLCTDAREPSFQQDSFDLIICNPPFFSQKNHRASQSKYRHHARRDDSLLLHELFACVEKILKSIGGFYLVFPKQRTNEIQHCSQSYGFEIHQNQEYRNIRKRSGGIVLFELKTCRQKVYSNFK